MTDWIGEKVRREQIVRDRGQWVGLLDKDWVPVMDIEDWESATWGEVFQDTANLEMVIPGEIAPGVQNPVVRYLLQAGSTDPDGLFHDAVTVVVERPGARGTVRRFYRVFDIIPEGGREYPERLTITGLDGLEYLKHLPLWADPTNRSKVVQLQFEDRQSGQAEFVSRKLIGRNLIGYQQPSMLTQIFDGHLGAATMTEDYADPTRWRVMNSAMHRIICSPVPSGIRSEFCIVTARWDNAWDLMKPTWEAAGILPIVSLWLPGDEQPFPDYTTLELPTVIVDFRPVSTICGARTSLGRGIRYLTRKIDAGDRLTSMTEFTDTTTPTRAGLAPWVVFDCEDAPKLTIRKSTDSRFLVGGKSPKLVNTVVKAGIKAGFAALAAAVPVIGPPIAELIKGAGDMIAEMSADRFLNLNEHQDRDRVFRHGRSGYLSVAKQGEANSMDSIQKAWQAKTETNGGLSVEFTLDDTYPYVAGKHFQLGDTVGLTAWGETWASYVSEITWTSEADDRAGYTVKLGDLRQMTDPETLINTNFETVRGRLSRLTSTIS